jgi:hypothetical protein
MDDWIRNVFISFEKYKISGIDDCLNNFPSKISHFNDILINIFDWSMYRITQQEKQRPQSSFHINIKFRTWWGCLYQLLAQKLRSSYFEIDLRAGSHSQSTFNQSLFRLSSKVWKRRVSQIKLAKTLWHSCMTIYPGWFQKQTRTSHYCIGHFIPNFSPNFQFQTLDESPFRLWTKVRLSTKDWLWLKVVRLWDRAKKRSMDVTNVGRFESTTFELRHQSYDRELHAAARVARFFLTQYIKTREK